ncbi:MAG: hypothetical protein KME18_24055 [Phormidium tanganyikae FI6-MK23]|jgi:hypothetical protein|nr:hypothetical protein [Phormidium tanganyikae FI6-MK23]
MTWHTHIGDRILTGIEAEVYLIAMQHAIDYLEDAIEYDDDFDVKTYDRIFDLASFDQKILLLHTCLSALLKPDVKILELSNVLEAAAYFPFAFLRRRIAEEIELSQGDWLDEEDDEELGYFYRRLVWKAFEEYVLPNWKATEEEYGVDEDEAAFNDRSNNLELWDEVIEELIDRIFWDRDWMVTWTSPRVLDGIEDEISEPLGLEDYFTNRLPKVSAEESATALAEIRNWKLDDNHKK